MICIDWSKSDNNNFVNREQAKSESEEMGEISKEKFFEFKRQNNVLQMELKALKDPYKKEIQSLKTQLGEELKQKEQYRRELKRLQREKTSMDNTMSEFKPPPEEGLGTSGSGVMTVR